jgi:hypothetical protein
MLCRLSVGQPSQLSMSTPFADITNVVAASSPTPSSAVAVLGSPHLLTASPDHIDFNIADNLVDEFIRWNTPDINAALAVTNPDWADVGWGSPVPAPDTTWNLADDEFDAIFPPLPIITFIHLPIHSNLLAQVAPSPEPVRPAAVTAALNAARRSLSPVPSDAELPPYSERPRPAERVIRRAQWDPYPNSRPQPHPNRCRSYLPEPAPPPFPDRRTRRRTNTQMRARRTTNRIVEARHHDKARDYLEWAPLPVNWDEYDRLTARQRFKVARLFSIENSLLNFRDDEYQAILNWKRTVIQEWQEEIEADWTYPCIECRLPRGPWCTLY